MRSVKLAGDDIVEELLPVRLGNDLDLKTFFFEEAFSLAMTMGAQSVSLMKPNFSSSFSTSSISAVSDGMQRIDSMGTDSAIFMVVVILV